MKETARSRRRSVLTGGVKKDLPSFAALLKIPVDGPDEQRARALTPEEQRAVVPLVRSLEAVINGYWALLGIHPHSVIPDSSVPVSERRAPMAKAVRLIDALQETLSSVHPADRAAMQLKGVDVADLEGRLHVARETFGAKLKDWPSGESGRPIDAPRRWMVYMVRKVLDSAGFPCAKSRDGAFAGILARVFVAAGLEPLSDYLPLVREIDEIPDVAYEMWGYFQGHRLALDGLPVPELLVLRPQGEHADLIRTFWANMSRIAVDAGYLPAADARALPADPIKPKK